MVLERFCEYAIDVPRPFSTGRFTFLFFICQIFLHINLLSYGLKYPPTHHLSFPFNFIKVLFSVQKFCLFVYLFSLGYFFMYFIDFLFEMYSWSF